MSDSFIKSIFTSTTEESLIFVSSIYDLFLPFSETSAPRSGITTDMSNYLQQKTLDNAKTRDLNNSTATEEDISFSKQVSSLTGIFWHLGLFCMSHPNPLIRLRSFDFLCRISPFVPSALSTTAFITIATVSNYRENKDDNEWKNTTTLHEALLSLKKNFNAKSISSSKETALKVSELMAKYRPSYTEHVFKEMFQRWESISSYSMKKWIVSFLVYWLSNINLGDSGIHTGTKKTTNLILDNEQVFLSKIYDIITFNDFKHMSDDVLNFWAALANPHNNLQMCVEFLLSKACLFEQHLEIARTIILHLYKLNPEKGVIPLVSHLSFAGIRNSLGSVFFDVSTDLRKEVQKKPSEVKSSEEVSDSVENSDEPKYDENKHQNKNERLNLPIVSSLIIMDILREPPKPLIPHYAVLINYALLEGFNVGNKSGSQTNVAELMKSIFISLKTALDKKKSKGDNAIDLISTLDSIIYSLEIGNFEINWSAYKYISSVEEKKMVSLETTRAQMTLQHEMQYNEEFKVLEPWASKPIKPSELVTTICQCFEIVKPSLITKWGQEAFFWFKNTKDMKVSITAVEMYKSILEPINSETSFTFIARIRDIFKSLENVKKSPSNNEEKEDKTILLLFGKAEQILLAILRSIPFLDDFHELHRIFWLSMAILKSEGNSYLLNLHPLAYQITIKLLSNNYFSNFSSNSEHLKLFNVYAYDFEFTGIQHILLLDLYKKQTSLSSSKLAVILPNVSPPSMVDSANDDHKRFAINIMIVLPWLHYQLIYIFHSTDEEEKSGFLIAKEFAIQLEKADAPYPETISALKKYSEGFYNDKGEAFVEAIVEEIYQHDFKFLSHVLGLLYEKIIVKVNKRNYSNSIFLVVNSFFKKEEENMSEETTKHVGHFGTIVRESYQYQTPLAKELLGRAVRLTFTECDGNIEPLLKPFKPPSQIKHGKQSSKALNKLLRKEKEKPKERKTGNLSRRRNSNVDIGPLPFLKPSEVKSDPERKLSPGMKLDLGKLSDKNINISSPRRGTIKTPRTRVMSRELEGFSVVTMNSLLEDEKQRYYFDLYLKDNSIVSREISFCDDVNVYCHISDNKQAATEAKIICDKYLRDDSPSLIDLASNFRENQIKKLEQNPQAPSSNFFHTCYDKVVEKLKESFFIKFRMSDHYLDLLGNFVKQSGMFDEEDFDSFDWHSSEEDDEDEDEGETEEETEESSGHNEKDATNPNDFSDLSQLASGLDLSLDVDLDF